MAHWGTGVLLHSRVVCIAGLLKWKPLCLLLLLRQLPTVLLVLLIYSRSKPPFLQPNSPTICIWSNFGDIIQLNANTLFGLLFSLNRIFSTALYNLAGFRFIFSQVVWKHVLERTLIVAMETCMHHYFIYHNVIGLVIWRELLCLCLVGAGALVSCGRYDEWLDWSLALDT